MLLVASLVLLLQADDKPALGPLMRGLKYVLAHQREDGSWGAPPTTCRCRPAAGNPGGDLESTAWALLALYGSGYTELSKGDLEGFQVGPKIKSGLEWLIARQDKDGAFD